MDHSLSALVVRVSGGGAAFVHTHVLKCLLVLTRLYTQTHSSMSSVLLSRFPLLSPGLFTEPGAHGFD